MSYPILFAIIGAATGLIISAAANYFEHESVYFYLFAHALWVALFSFVWKKQSTPTLIISMLAMGAIFFGLTHWFVSQGYNGYRLNPVFVFTLIQISSICSAFIQSWKPGKPHFFYDDLFENAWNNHFYLIFSALLTAGFLLILALGTSLFESINIKISKLIWSQETTPVIVATLIGTGIGISREYGSLIYKIRGVFFAIFRVMAYLAAAIVILFSVSLPFSLGSLFENRNTSTILLSLVALSILLLNTLLDMPESRSAENNQPEKEKSFTLSLWKNRLFSVQIILLPMLSLLSVYAISLRIQQYGLMPRRIVVLVVAILLSIYALTYLIQLFKYKGQWTKGLAVVNPPLAILWVISLIALASPLVDPVRLSVNNQVERLQNKTMDIEMFDFNALKYKLGNRGKTALNDILGWENHPKITEIKQAIANLPDHDKPEELVVEIIGDTPKELDKLKSMLSEWRCNRSTPCYVKHLDMAGDGLSTLMIFIFTDGYLSAELYEFDKNLEAWELAKVYGNDQFNHPPANPNAWQSQPLNGAQKKAIIETLKQNKEKLIKPEYMDLDIGGIKLRQ